MPLKHLLTILLLLSLLFCKGQNRNDNLIFRCKEKAFAHFTEGGDSATIARHIQFDFDKSSYFDKATNTYRPILQGADSFNIDGVLLSFALLYKGDTLRNLYCEFDTSYHLISRLPHPGRFRSLIEPYLALFEGKLTFDYKKLKLKLGTTDLGTSYIKSIELMHAPVINYTKKVGKYYSTKTQYYWVVFTDCPESKCRQLEISATTGSVIADDLVKTH